MGDFCSSLITINDSGPLLSCYNIIYLCLSYNHGSVNPAPWSHEEQSMVAQIWHPATASHFSSFPSSSSSWPAPFFHMDVRRGGADLEDSFLLAPSLPCFSIHFRPGSSAGSWLVLQMSIVFYWHCLWHAPGSLSWSLFCFLSFPFTPHRSFLTPFLSFSFFISLSIPGKWLHMCICPYYVVYCIKKLV